MDFSRIRTQLQPYCLEVRAVLLFVQPNVYKCPNCAAEIQQGSPYCPSCGKVPKVSAGPSYQAAWLFVVIGLLAVGCYWVAVTASKEAETPTPSPTPALDAAARLVKQCGKPDMDSIIPAKLQPKTPERWALSYRSARVRAVFERDAPQSSDGWKNVKYFDPASKKQLNSQQVLKRLPCAVNTTP
jgi:hypothetical protein